jgi:hypothetical protein
LGSAQPAQVTTAQPAQVTTAKPAQVTTAKPAQVTTAKPAQVTTAKPAQVTTAPAPTPTQTPTPAQATDDRARFEQLAALEARDPSAAIAGYLELSGKGGRWGEVGLYAAARLAADRRDARAATLLAIYLRRSPSGANADDVRLLLARIQKGPTR